MKRRSRLTLFLLLYSRVEISDDLLPDLRNFAFFLLRPSTSHQHYTFVCLRKKGFALKVSLGNKNWHKEEASRISRRISTLFLLLCFLLPLSWGWFIYIHSKCRPWNRPEMGVFRRRCLEQVFHFRIFRIFCPLHHQDRKMSIRFGGERRKKRIEWMKSVCVCNLRSKRSCKTTNDTMMITE